MRNDFEERKQARIERLEASAERASLQAEASFKQADDLSQAFWGGQPILIGHHSEGKMRRTQETMHNKMRSGLALEKKAKNLQSRAEAASSNNAIFSDDPNASEKLAEKIARLEARQRLMRDANKYAAKNDVEGLTALGFSPDSITTLLNPRYTYEKKGFQGWQLTNNSANIRRLKQRLEQQLALESLETSEVEINGVKIVENVEANRLQMFFDGKPSDETRKMLKGRGFRWSPSEGAWQRHISNGATYAAKEIANSL